MTVLLPPLTPKVQFKSVEIAPDVVIEIQLTAPSYLQVCADRSIVDNTEANLARMECITGWRGVVREVKEQAEFVDVPFSKDALAALWVAYPKSFHAMWEIVSQLYRPDSKNARSPASAPHAGEKPATSTSTSEASAS